MIHVWDSLVRTPDLDAYYAGPAVTIARFSACYAAGFQSQLFSCLLIHEFFENTDPTFHLSAYQHICSSHGYGPSRRPVASTSLTEPAVSQEIS
jgi:hypothetical protein